MAEQIFEDEDEFPRKRLLRSFADTKRKSATEFDEFDFPVIEDDGSVVIAPNLAQATKNDNENDKTDGKDERPARKTLKPSKAQKSAEEEHTLTIQYGSPESESDLEFPMIAADDEVVEATNKTEEGDDDRRKSYEVVKPQKIVDEAAAEEAWSQVEQAMLQDQKEIVETKAGQIADMSNRSDQLISYKDFVELLSKQDMTPYERKIEEKDFRNYATWTLCWFLVCGRPGLGDDKLRKERFHIFCFAKMKIDYNYIEHERALQTIYKTLTGNQLRCARYGAHWEVIGFQGNDPTTDVRAVGLFGLIQMLYFIKYWRDLVMKIFKLSRDERQNFPFMVVSFNITGIILQQLREMKLYDKIKKEGSVFNVINKLFVAAFYRLYLIWVKEQCTIINFGDALRKLKRACHDEVDELIEDLDNSTKTMMETENIPFANI